MAKVENIYICQQCGFESRKWLGKCPSCLAWDVFVEEIRNEAPKTPARGLSSVSSKPVVLSEISTSTEDRMKTGIGELDRVLGGGLVRGSLVLVGGDPGIGKSTLLLQVCDKMAKQAVSSEAKAGTHKSNGKGNILYISGEESAKQIKIRADRLGVNDPGIMMLPETDFSLISGAIHEIKPSLVVIDSIQTMYCAEIASAPGSVSQVREVTAGLLRIAKQGGFTVIIVGHVTKEGAIAGPRVLEHMVDTVLYFEGERNASYRILRSVKNRFGSTNEIGMFEMRDIGLCEILNPSEVLLYGRPSDVPGSVIVPGVEGTRCMLLEIQALVCPTAFGMPRRMAAGVDYNRIALLIAVLEKRVELMLHNFDSYVNVAGGIKIDEPAADLGIAIAIASSFKNMAVDSQMAFIGEIGLTGEIRNVNLVEKRVLEAARTGFKSCMVPKSSRAALLKVKDLQSIEIIGVENIMEALSICFRKG